MTAAGVTRRSRAPHNLSGLVPLPRAVRAVIAAAVLTASLALASSASATSSLSQNWAGYAVHGTTFQGASASWRQPRPLCQAAQPRYSAMWVGLGGYSLTSGALEQVGTELDCVQGHVASSAWYELVPSPSHTLAMPVRPGDLITASVTAAGGGVTVAINDVTRHRSFRRTFAPTTLDVSSAEWILEAPSACVPDTVFCRTLPLADFKQATFTNVRAQAAGGTVGGIVSSAWQHSKIVLGPGGTQFVGTGAGTTAVGTAHPSSPSNRGSAFTISYGQRYVPATQLYGSRMRPGPQTIVHPGRS